MALIIPRLPTELWEYYIIPLLQTPESSYDKLNQIELMIRIGHKRQIKQCSYLLEGNNIKWVHQIICYVYHPIMIDIRLSKHVDLGGDFEEFCRKEHEIDLFTELEKY